ncbi:MAG: type transport system permease protein [Nocardioidaceae bacterium]|nr:type transport system permease protein [Nocardioidaceae bacterium]
MSAVPSLSFAPAPGRAPFPSMVWSHARMETRLLVRNGEQLLLALVIPLLLLVGGAESGGVVNLGAGRRIDVLTPGVLALAVMSTSFTSLAIATGFERRYGVLKRLGATPLTRGGLLLGKVVCLVLVEAVQVALVAGAGVALGWRPHAGPADVGWALTLGLAGTAAFAALALLMAGTLRAEATLAAANLVYILLLVAGAVVVPLSSYPSGMRDLATLLPSGALAEGLRESLSGGSIEPLRLLVLVVWAVIGAAATMRVFRWE